MRRDRDRPNRAALVLTAAACGLVGLALAWPPLGKALLVAAALWGVLVLAAASAFAVASLLQIYRHRRMVRRFQRALDLLCAEFREDLNSSDESSHASDRQPDDRSE